MKKQTIITLFLVLTLELGITIGVASLLVYIFSITNGNSVNYAIDLVIGVAASFIATFIMLFFTKFNEICKQVKKVQTHVETYLYTQGYKSEYTCHNLYVDNSFINYTSNFYYDVCSMIPIKKANAALDNLLHIIYNILDESKANNNSFYNYANLFNQLSSASEALW